MVKKYKLLFVFQHDVPEEIGNYSKYLNQFLPDLLEHLVRLTNLLLSLFKILFSSLLLIF